MRWFRGWTIDSQVRNSRGFIWSLSESPTGPPLRSRNSASPTMRHNTTESSATSPAEAWAKKAAPQLSLGRAAGAAGRWTAGAAAVTAVVQFTQLAVMGRLLLPGDFGLMAMMMVVVTLANFVVDLGVSNYVVRTTDLSKGLFNALLVLCIVAGVGVTLVVAAAAPLVAAYYRSPRLEELLPWLGLTSMAAAVAQPSVALLQRHLRFRDIAVVDVAASSIGLIAAVSIAVAGGGVWALVGGQVGNAVARAAIAALIGIFPMGGGMAVDFRGLGAAIRFGKFQVGERILNFAGWNVDKVIVGRFLGNSALGVYSVAFQLVLKPFSILNPIFGRIALPLLSLVQDDDARLSRGYLEVVRTAAFISFPVYLLLLVSNDAIVLLLLGDKWARAADLVSIWAGWASCSLWET